MFVTYHTDVYSVDVVDYLISKGWTYNKAKGQWRKEKSEPVYVKNRGTDYVDLFGLVQSFDCTSFPSELTVLKRANSSNVTKVRNMLLKEKDALACGGNVAFFDGRILFYIDGKEVGLEACDASGAEVQFAKDLWSKVVRA